MGDYKQLIALVIYILLTVNEVDLQITHGILYPQENEVRERKSLDGIWNFRISPRLQPDLGFDEEWFNSPLSQTGHVDLMPVPSSYNDVGQNATIRDHIGWAWYDTEFWAPKHWATNSKIFIRFGGVNYYAIVWINGQLVTEYSGCHMTFEAEITPQQLFFTSPNRLTVAINNTLNDVTIPQGSVQFRTGDKYPEGYFKLEYTFDFFHYAGIHRPVFLYSTPSIYIKDITVVTDAPGVNTGLVFYQVQLSSSTSAIIRASLLDKLGNSIALNIGSSGTLTIPYPKLWWPFTMVENEDDAGYLYTLVVELINEGHLDDIYRLKVGIRSDKWDNRQFYINDRPFYFRGFGRHEDFSIKGKGVDNAVLVKDHNLIKWFGANSYRTSHYPYSEELMDITDELGIVIIDEVASVDTDIFSSELLANHKQQMAELIQRDKNRASVVMWSVANEPRSSKVESADYFREVFALTRDLDSSRPVTLVTNLGYNNDLTAAFMDIICINRYNAWYSDVGQLETVKNGIISEVQNWIFRFNRPVIIAEYGADTIAGLHMSPEFVFTEEFQTKLLTEYFKAFDFLRRNTTLIGEMIWNFADFNTQQGITRVAGNKKGVLTRDRQPKASAHLLRARYHLLAEESDGHVIPDDIRDMIPIYTDVHRRIEL